MKHKEIKQHFRAGQMIIIQSMFGVIQDWWAIERNNGEVMSPEEHWELWVNIGNVCESFRMVCYKAELEATETFEYLRDFAFFRAEEVMREAAENAPRIQIPGG